MVDGLVFPEPLLLESPYIVRARAMRGVYRAPDAESPMQAILRWATDDYDRVAVVDSTQSISYGRLASAMAATASRLHGAGVRRGDRVAVCGTRSADALVVLLAIQSLEAIEVPIPSNWPVDRVLGVLKDVQAAHLLALDAAAGSRFASQSDLQPILRDSGTSLFHLAASVHFHADAHPPRYIMYTSGSTGKPKGCVVSVAGWLNHLHALIGLLRLTRQDVVAWTAPIGHVISVWQIGAAALAGARIAIVDDTATSFPRPLVNALERHEVTVVQLTPTVAEWVDVELERSPRRLATVRAFIFTGERVSVELAARIRRRLPSAALFNAYGASECSDDVTVHKISHEDFSRTSIPVGRPIDNAVVHVLIEEPAGWRSASPGESGEIWVGGAGVGLGYIDDGPGRSSGGFFRDTIDGEDLVGRLFRMGDQGKMVDGVLYCEGRNDRQIKIGGVRIELDDVEAALASLPGVSQCMVVKPGTAVGSLTAYVVGARTLDAERLSALIRDVLPPLMVPRHIRVVPALPMTVSGKLDRKSLEEIEQAWATRRLP